MILIELARRTPILGCQSPHEGNHFVAIFGYRAVFTYGSIAHFEPGDCVMNVDVGDVATAQVILPIHWNS